MSTYDVAIIGAGPAGIMAAISAATEGAKVVLLEKNEMIGRKVLATGNGRCNLTNINITAANYHGKNSNFAIDVISEFDQEYTLRFFNEIGLITKLEDRGRVFPVTNQASSVVEILKEKLEDLNVETKKRFEVKSLEKLKLWVVTDKNGKEIQAKRLVLCTGGKAAFQFGSSGDGLFWAKNLGHNIEEIHAGLVPLETVETWPKDIQGLKVHAATTVIADGKEVANRSGDLLFTHYGLSGPAILGLIRTIGPLLGNKKVLISVDLFPDSTFEELDNIIERLVLKAGKKNIKNSLIGILPQNIIPLVLKLSFVDEGKKAAELSKKERLQVTNLLKNIRLEVKSLRPLKEAQVTVGGVSTRDINPKTLESLLVKDLYFAGEIIDIDADSGGFNLQWAWSSGKIAGKSAALKIN